jgi:protein TonB
VVVRVSVQSDGKVGNAVVSKSSGHKVLDEAALEAVKNWRFRPAQRAGQAVNATLDVPVVFQLEQS